MAEHKLEVKNKSQNVPEKPAKKGKFQLVEAKETGLQKFKRMFLAEDVGDIGDYLLEDLVVPLIKDAFLDFMRAALWGTRVSYRDGGRSNSKQTNYTAFSSNSRSRRESSVRDDNQRHDYQNEGNAYLKRRNDILNNIVFKTKAEAEDFLDVIEDEIEESNIGAATLGFVYDQIGVSSIEPTDESVGWTRIIRDIEHVSNGWRVRLPKLERIKKNNY